MENQLVPVCPLRIKVGLQALQRKRIYLLIGLFAVVFYVMSYYILWWLALIILLLWGAFVIVPAYSRLVQIDARLAVWFCLLVTQTPHFGEHCAQMLQIHLFGWPGLASHGIFGRIFDVEWFHFFFDSMLIPFTWGWLLCLYGERSNRWLWTGTPLVLWHCAEHFAIMSVYLRTGIVGSPGLLAQGGMLWGGLPLSRPDLHFVYNLGEEWLILQGFRYEFRQSSLSWAWVCRPLFT
jgi:hypothetical protein